MSFRLPSYDNYIKYYAYKSLYESISRAIEEIGKERVAVSILVDMIESNRFELLSEFELQCYSLKDNVEEVVGKYNYNTGIKKYKEEVNNAARKYKEVVNNLSRPTVKTVDKEIKKIMAEVEKELLRL